MVFVSVSVWVQLQVDATPLLLTILSSTPTEEMPREDIAPIAEAKEAAEPPGAPLRLMTQFLRAVSESRMEDALALSQTSRRCKVGV